MKMPIIFCFAALVMISCSKTHSANPNFSLKINGTNYTFDSVTALVDTANGAYVTAIHAANTKSHSYVSIEAQSNIKSLNGTYSRLFPQPTDHILPTFTVVIFSGQYVLQYYLLGETFTFTIDNASNTNMHGSFMGAISDISLNKSASISGQFETPYNFR